MPVTALDPKTALIVIDLQKGLASIETAHPFADVVHRASRLAGAFRARGLPVVLVAVDGRPRGRTEQSRSPAEMPPAFAELLPELNRAPEDHVVTKRTAGAFTGTDLEAHLRARGVTQVVIVGVATSMGVESTARHAHELGFNVALAVDAMTDTSDAAHVASITRIFPRIAETGTTQEILSLLETARAHRPGA